MSGFSPLRPGLWWMRRWHLPGKVLSLGGLVAVALAAAVAGAPWWLLGLAVLAVAYALLALHISLAGDLAALAPLVKTRVAEIALFGASREYFEKAWQGIVPMTWHATLEPAIKHLAAAAQAGDVVLMAPATSSFDLYANYEERGKDFKRIVGRLA